VAWNAPAFAGLRVRNPLIFAEDFVLSRALPPREVDAAGLYRPPK
jgi:hypothetical protein